MWLTTGGFVAAGYVPELDQLRELRDDSRRAIAALQARYAEATGIASLRIRHNNVIGYYVEVSAAAIERLGTGKLGIDFIHRQTMAGAQRYTTGELAELESRIASAAAHSESPSSGFPDLISISPMSWWAIARDSWNRVMSGWVSASFCRIARAERNSASASATLRWPPRRFP